MSTTSQASQRIASLLDDNSFVEIGAMVTARSTDFNLKQTETPSDGVITGYGVIGGNLVYVYSQDASVLNGSVGEMHAKKIANLYDLALKTGAPVIGLIESAGLRLQEATDALNGFGEIYKKQVLSSGVIPQITAIFGSCGGGLALIPTLTDFTFMEESKAKLFVNAPNALDGNVVTKCDTASAAFQSEEAGNVDVVADEATVLAKIRELVSMLPANNDDDAFFEDCTDDLNRACENMEGAVADPAIALSQISDNGQVFEVKSAYAKEMVTALIKLDGVTVGAVANRTALYDENGEAEKFDAVLTPAGCEKAADFVNFPKPLNWLEVTGMFSWGDWRWGGVASGYLFDSQGQMLQNTRGDVVTDMANAEQYKYLIDMDNVSVGGSAQTTAALGLGVRPVKGLRLGVDWNFFSRNYADYDINASSATQNEPYVLGSPWKIPSYSTFDLNASYSFDFGKIRATLSGNVNNVLDQEYIADARDGSTHDWESATRVLYGFGRTYSVRLKFNF